MRLFFWGFVLAMAMLCPVTMLVLGRRFVDAPPKQINSFYGYRTARSMQNPETWAFAHRSCGQYWRRTGKWLLALSVLIMGCVFGRDVDTISGVGLVLIAVQLIPLVFAVPVTERALKRSFDPFGRNIANHE